MKLETAVPGEGVRSSLKGEESSWTQETEMTIETKILHKGQNEKLRQMPCLRRQAMRFSLGLEKGDGLGWT